MKMKTNDVSCNRTDHFNMTRKNACRWDQTKNKSTQKLSARNFENRLLICKQSAFYQLSRAMPCHAIPCLSLYTDTGMQSTISVYTTKCKHILSLFLPLCADQLLVPSFPFAFFLCTQSDGFQWKETRFINKSSHLDMLIISTQKKK